MQQRAKSNATQHKQLPLHSLTTTGVACMHALSVSWCHVASSTSSSAMATLTARHTTQNKNRYTKIKRHKNGRTAAKNMSTQKLKFIETSATPKLVVPRLQWRRWQHFLHVQITRIFFNFSSWHKIHLTMLSDLLFFHQFYFFIIYFCRIAMT